MALVLVLVCCGCGASNVDPAEQKQIEMKQKAVETPEDKANHD